jgi:hypothetical protein
MTVFQVDSETFAERAGRRIRAAPLEPSEALDAANRRLEQI